MKIGKKLVCLSMLVLVLICSSVGLAAPVKLTIWSRGTPQYLEAYHEMEKGFLKRYPNIKVEHLLFADLEDRLVTTFMGGEASDLWIMDAVTTGRWIRHDMVMPINKSKFSNAKQVLAGAWRNCMDAKGKVYALPFSVQAQAMYYRADWLKKLNLKVPTTWDEMVKVAVAFTTKDPDGNGKNDTYGIGVYGSVNRGYAYWTFQDWLWQAGGRVLKSTKKGKWVANLNTAACKKALQFEKDLAFKYKVFQPSYTVADSAAVYGTFADGMTGMIFHAGYRILEYKSRLGDGLGTALMPAGPAGSWVLGEGENIYINKKTKHAREARLFANWMLSPQAQKFGLKNSISNIVRTSVRKDINNLDVTGEPLMQAFVDAFQKNVRYPEPIPDYFPVKILVSELVQKTISDPHSNINALINEYNTKVNLELKKQGVYIN
jgi:multiple sugar transport system substrate-binding protein